MSKKRSAKEFLADNADCVDDEHDSCETRKKQKVSTTSSGSSELNENINSNEKANTQLICIPKRLLLVSGYIRLHFDSLDKFPHEMVNLINSYFIFNYSKFNQKEKKKKNEKNKNTNNDPKDDSEDEYDDPLVRYAIDINDVKLNYLLSLKKSKINKIGLGSNKSSYSYSQNTSSLCPVFLKNSNKLDSFTFDDKDILQSGGNGNNYNYPAEYYLDSFVVNKFIRLFKDKKACEHWESGANLPNGKGYYRSGFQCVGKFSFDNICGISRYCSWNIVETLVYNISIAMFFYLNNQITKEDKTEKNKDDDDSDSDDWSVSSDESKIILTKDEWYSILTNNYQMKLNKTRKLDDWLLDEITLIFQSEKNIRKVLQEFLFPTRAMWNDVTCLHETNYKYYAKLNVDQQFGLLLFYQLLYWRNNLEKTYVFKSINDASKKDITQMKGSLTKLIKKMVERYNESNAFLCKKVLTHFNNFDFDWNIEPRGRKKKKKDSGDDDGDDDDVHDIIEESWDARKYMGWFELDFGGLGNHKNINIRDCVYFYLRQSFYLREDYINEYLSLFDFNNDRDSECCNTKIYVCFHNANDHFNEDYLSRDRMIAIVDNVKIAVIFKYESRRYG